MYSKDTGDKIKKNDIFFFKIENVMFTERKKMWREVILNIMFY